MSRLRLGRPSPWIGVAAALLISVSSTSAYATVKNFMLGTTNTSDAPTTVAAAANWPTTGSQKLLQLTNTKTTAGATALGLNVAAGHAPFTVNSGTKVTNLNADKLDGIDSSGFYRFGTSVANSELLSGESYNQVLHAALPKVSMAYSFTGVHQNFTRYFSAPTGDVLVFLNASAYAQSAGSFLRLCVAIDGRGTNACAVAATNEGLSHKTLVSQPALVAVNAGSHNVTLYAGTSQTLTNNDDFYSVTIMQAVPD